jgi:MFS family permease
VSAAATVPTPRSGTFRSFRVRNFRLYFAGQVVSQSGTWMQTIALGWLVLQLSNNSGVAVGFVIALQYLPTLLFGVWGGVIADAFDKRKVMIITQTCMTAIAALLAIVVLADVVQLWMIYVIVIANGLALAVDNPTRQSFVVELVGPEDLSNAVGLTSALFQTARVVGPAIAGVLIVAVGTGVCFLFNSVSFVAVIVALVMLRPSELHRGKPIGRAKGQVREGLQYIWRTRELRAALLATAVIGTLALNSQVVLPLMAKVVFDGNAATYSYMSVAMGAGALVGALAIASRAKATPEMFLFAGTVFGVAICAAALAPTLGLFLGLLLIVGAGQISFLSTCNSLIQLRSDPTMRGRVMSVYTITLLGSTPIGGPLVGLVCEVWGPRWGLAVGGVGTLVAMAVFGTAFVRACRAHGDSYELSRLPGGDRVVTPAASPATP